MSLKQLLIQKTHKWEYFYIAPEAVVDRGYSKISGGVQKHWNSDVLYCKKAILKV